MNLILHPFFEQINQVIDDNEIVSSSFPILADLHQNSTNQSKKKLLLRERSELLAFLIQSFGGFFSPYCVENKNKVHQVYFGDIIRLSNIIMDNITNY